MSKTDLKHLLAILAGQLIVWIPAIWFINREFEAHNRWMMDRVKQHTEEVRCMGERHLNNMRQWERPSTSSKP